MLFSVLRRSRVRTLGLSMFVAALAATAGQAQSINNALLLWPVMPVITAESRASALWLENRGSSPLTLQIRVVGWKQAEYADRYVDQTDVVASPPFATVGPGRRQLVRLMRTVDAPPGSEVAYRVILDEIPQPSTSGAASAPDLSALAVKVRMRYSLPMFVYGAGMAPAGDGSKARPDAHDLSWQIVADSGKRWLVAQNSGTRHARLTHVGVAHLTGTMPIADGLLGYVLPGATMRWALPEASPAGDNVSIAALVNGVSTTGTPLRVDTALGSLSNGQ